jgi:adenine-specific DNA-methyltransferase
MAKKSNSNLTVETLTHYDATRKNIPTAEYQSVMRKDDQAPVKVCYPRGNTELADEKQTRNRDLDPQLVWRGKDQQDWSGSRWAGTLISVRRARPAPCVMFPGAI